MDRLEDYMKYKVCVGRFLIDIFASMIVTCLAVSVWWSAWMLVDELASSKQPVSGVPDGRPSMPHPTSAITHIPWQSLLIGYILISLVYLLQVRIIFCSMLHHVTT